MNRLSLMLCSIAFAAGCAGNAACPGDNCVCPANDSCEVTCSSGGDPCHVQCTPGEACDVQCAPGEECHVEATAATSLIVDCNGGSDCNVTCPASSCTVQNCAGDCNVTCGLLGIPSRTTTTATCP